MFRAIGKTLTGAAWPTGLYDGTNVLTRDGAQIDQTSAQVNVE